MRLRFWKRPKPRIVRVYRHGHDPECSCTQPGNPWCDCRGLPYRIDGGDSYEYVCKRPVHDPSSSAGVQKEER